MTEKREPYSTPGTATPDAPGALLLGPLGCPECGATMANMSDDHATICCMAPGCALRYVAFWRPTVPLQRASQPRPVFRPYEDFRAELVAEGRLPGKSTTSIDANGLGLDLSAYIGEECRLCGQELTAEDAAEATWAGDRARQSLCAMAHRRCWNGLVEVAGDLGFDVRAAVARAYSGQFMTLSI